MAKLVQLQKQPSTGQGHRTVDYSTETETIKVLGCDDRQFKKKLLNYFVNDTCRVSDYKILFSLFKGQGVLKDGLTLLGNILIKN